MKLTKASKLYDEETIHQYNEEYEIDFFELGMELRRSHKWKKAVPFLLKSTTYQQPSAEKFFFLAATLDHLGEESRAIEYYRTALELGLSDEQTVKALTWLASSYSKTGDKASAIECIESAISLGGYEPKIEFINIAYRVYCRTNSK